MSPKEFYRRLRSVGVDYSAAGIRKWARDGLIVGPTGRKRASTWPEQAVGETAAAYVLRDVHGTPLPTVRRAIEVIRNHLPRLRVEYPFEGVSWAVLTAAACAYQKAMRGWPLSKPVHVVYRQRYDRAAPGHWCLDVEAGDGDEDTLSIWPDREQAAKFAFPVHIELCIATAASEDADMMAHELVHLGVMAYARPVTKEESRRQPAGTRPEERHEVVVTLHTPRDLAEFQAYLAGVILHSAEDRGKYLKTLKRMLTRLDEQAADEAAMRATVLGSHDRDGQHAAPQRSEGSHGRSR